MPIFRENNESKGFWQQEMVVLSLRLSSWIVAPIIVGVLVGRWLDGKYGTHPWLFLSSVGLAFVISIFGLVTNSIKEINRIEKESKK